MNDQLRADNMPIIIKLYEAMLSMPIRMRVAPTLKQVIMDTITYSEDTFAAQEATADSCLDFVNKVRHLVNTKGLTQRQLIDELKKSNISFRGKAVGDQGVKSIQTVEPYAVSGAVRGGSQSLGAGDEEAQRTYHDV